MLVDVVVGEEVASCATETFGFGYVIEITVYLKNNFACVLVDD